MDRTGRSADAEAWYRKALAVFQAAQIRDGEARTLNNLANLVSREPSWFAEARSLGERSLAIQSDLDPAASEIWKTHSILADIADREGYPEIARDQRRRERAALAAAPLAREMLRPHRPLMAAAAAAAADPALRPALGEVLEGMSQHGWQHLVGALRRVVDGERDEDALCNGLDRENSLIVGAVLRGLADPATLLEEDEPAGEQGGDAGGDAAQAELLRRHLPLIRAVLAAASHPEPRTQLDPLLEQLQQNGWGALVGAILRMQDGERGAEALFAGLDHEDGLILAAILAGLEDPGALGAPDALSPAPGEAGPT